MNTPLPQLLPVAPLDGPSEPVDPDRLVSGQPVTRYASAFASADGRLDVGRWEGTVGSWRVSYSETEVCLLLAGRVRLTSAAGEAREFVAGQAFLVPGGFEGVWEVLEPARKLYVIYQP